NPGGFVDPTVTMHALVAVQAALLHRDRTRQAQVIEVAQCEVGACITAEQVIAYSASGKLLSRTGNRSDTMAPQGIYPCADKELVAISVRDDAEWEKLVEMMGSPELQAQRGQLRSLAQRQARSDDIDRIIVEWTRGMASDAVLKLVRGAGLPIARVLKAEKMNGDLHLSYRRFYEELPHQRTGVRPYAGWPMRFSVGPTRHHRLGPPTLGQHNFEILSEEAGLTPGEIEELARKDIIGTIPKGLG
ncbi:MAG: CoA transferase, partial [Chloroflexi bacterium]|nr:CoA transferase [Chloroflexota bacterium]